MYKAARITIGLILALAAAGVAGCGKSGSSGTAGPASAATGAGCAPVAGSQLVVLTDDKHLQASDNVVPAINTKAASQPLIDALNHVSAALALDKLIALNKAVDVDRKTPKVAAQDFLTSSKFTDGIQKGGGGKIIIGAANFSENQILGELYRLALAAAGFDATVQQIGNRELYLPSLEKGDIQVAPEYAGTLTEFINKKVNGANASTLASGDIDKTMTALKDLGTKVGLTFGQPAEAADQNAFAVTKAFSDKYGVQTLSEFASKCSGKASVLGGPAECPQRPFCKIGLEQTYKIQFGDFKSLDSAGPETKNALKSGVISIGLVLSSDGELASG